eukprot:13933566-Alexandrium_andersonii.AAC.1
MRQRNTADILVSRMGGHFDRLGPAMEAVSIQAIVHQPVLLPAVFCEPRMCVSWRPCLVVRACMHGARSHVHMCIIAITTLFSSLSCSAKLACHDGSSACLRASTNCVLLVAASA